MKRILTAVPILLALFLSRTVSGQYAKDAPGQSYEPTTSYQRKTLHGFRIYISSKVAPHQAEAAPALKLLDEKLEEITRIVPTDRLKRLREVAIWVEWENRKDGAAEYHLSPDWLKENHYNPDKAKGVEIRNLLHFEKWTREDQPMMVLHELAHSYHDRVLSIENADVKAAFDCAVKSGSYDKVPYVHGQVLRAYALNNSQEYFAEITEAYFGHNDYYPFTREELKKHDPQGYALMKKVWGEPLHLSEKAAPDLNPDF
jgi:hypothetical protein